MKLEELYYVFHEIAANPREQMNRYIAEGKKIVLTAPVYTPNEIIHSMGLVPMGVWGANITVTESKRYFPAFICSIMQSILELGIKGKYAGASALVIPLLCDSLKCLGENWKYAVPDIRYVPMSYPQNRRTKAGIRYSEAGYLRIIRDLEQITGAQFEEARLKESIHRYNRHNQLMREFAALAADCKVTATQRNDIFKSAFFLTVEEHTEMMETLNALLRTKKAESTGKRVLISGILGDAEDLLKTIDDSNLWVVWDDLANQTRQYCTDTPETYEKPLHCLAQKFARMGNCSLLYDPYKERISQLIEEAQTVHADGIIFLMTKFCDPEEFDFALLNKACYEAGIHTVVIEVDRQMTNYGQANTMIHAFCEML